MKLRQSTDTPQPNKHIVRELADLRTAAFLNAVAALALLVGFPVLAEYTGYTALAWLGLVALLPALRAVWLWQDTGRYAQNLPPRPERKKPSHWLRIWWWLRSRPPRVKTAKEPFRRVKVGDKDEVKLPRQEREMAHEQERIVIKQHRYTASDVYFIVCRAASEGLAERGWNFTEGQRLTLPSGAPLTRAGFRAVQAWLVDEGHAVAKPSYSLTTTPEAILETL